MQIVQASRERLGTLQESSGKAMSVVWSGVCVLRLRVDGRWQLEPYDVMCRHPK